MAKMSRFNVTAGNIIFFLLLGAMICDSVRIMPPVTTLVSQEYTEFA